MISKIKQINRDLLDRMTRLIIKAIHPEKIILFGSHAKGNNNHNSDIDILVVVKQNRLPRYKRSIIIYKALAGILIPKDILVYTVDEIEEWSEVPEAFVTTAVREGKLLYEKK